MIEQVKQVIPPTVLGLALLSVTVGIADFLALLAAWGSVRGLTVLDKKPALV